VGRRYTGAVENWPEKAFLRYNKSQMKMPNLLHRASGVVGFLREVKTETKRVNWPTRDKTIKDTLIVVAFAVAVALFLSAFDYIFQTLLNTFFI